MKGYRCRCNLIICIILIGTFLTSYLPFGSTPFFQEVAAEHKEFEVNKFDENISILPNELQIIDLNLQEGEKIEVVFTLQVKEGLPVDVWFVNEDHYLLLKSGAQFLYFVDGSAQEVTYTRKIVTLTEYDFYKLVITNYYNNQTVEVNIVYEIRTYYTERGETSSEDLSIFFYLLFMTIIILVVLVTILFVKIRRLEQIEHKVTKKAPSKKPNVLKRKQVEPKATVEKSSMKAEAVISKQEAPKISEQTIPSFCGHCGKPVTTLYCTYCGRKVEII